MRRAALILFLATTAYAEKPRPKAILNTNVAPTYHTLLTELELRPSWNSTDGHFYAQNYLELGIRPTADTAISYQQEVISELSQYGTKQNATHRLYDGYLHTQIKNIWKAPNGELTFSHEGRVYAPTDEEKRAKGMILAARSYFEFNRDVTRNFAVLFMEVPILHVYDRDGYKALANPIFENQVWLEFDVKTAKPRWLLMFPIIFASTRYRNFASDPQGGGWGQWLEIYPELDYTVAPGVVLGAAYESGNILNVQTQVDPSVNPEVGSGTVQLVLRATF